MSDDNPEIVDVNKICDDARTFFMRFARGPAPRDLYDRQQWTMASLHLVVTNSIQNVYNRADGITPDQTTAFVQYSYFAYDMLHHHHWFEETVAFPMLEPEFKCDVLQEHAAFSKAMDRWATYLESVLGLTRDEKGKARRARGIAKAPYDAQILKKCIEDLVGPLFTHLQHEIEWLAPENLRDCGLPLSKLERLEATAERHNSSEIDLFSAGYFMLSHVSPGCGFPKIPPIIKKGLMPWVFYWRHRSVWRFVPKYS